MMEEVTSNVTIVVIVVYLDCHEVEYSGSKDPIFALVSDNQNFPLSFFNFLGN